MSALAEAERRRRSAEDVRRWRSLAWGAVCIISLLVGGYVIARVPVTGPLPLRDELVRFDGTIEKMRIGRSDHGCYSLSVVIDTGRGHIDGVNELLCDELKGVPPLAPGTVVSVLVEPTPDWYVVWEMRSGGWLLIDYEQMLAARKDRKRAYRALGVFVFVFCLPFLSIIVGYLWKEFHRLIGDRA
jgi:hypothetical protein